MKDNIILVIESWCNDNGYDVNDVFGISHRRDYANIRSCIYLTIKSMYYYDLKTIAKITQFAKSKQADHTTILKGIYKIETQLIYADVNELVSNIRRYFQDRLVY